RRPRVGDGGAFRAGVGEGRIDVARALGVFDLAGVGPALAAVGAARELAAPVAVVQRRPDRARARVLGRIGHVGALVAMRGLVPAAVAELEDESALAGGEDERVGHGLPFRVVVWLALFLGRLLCGFLLGSLCDGFLGLGRLGLFGPGFWFF